MATHRLESEPGVDERFAWRWISVATVVTRKKMVSRIFYDFCAQDQILDVKRNADHLAMLSMMRAVPILAVGKRKNLHVDNMVVGV